MTLAAPAALNQRAVTDGDRYELCGETCIAAIVQACGGQATPEDVTAWLRAKGGELSVSGGTDAAELDDAAVHWGLSAATMQTATVDALRLAYNSQNAYALALIWATTDGSPSAPGRAGAVGHWIVAYGEDGGPDDLVRVFNPWGLFATGPGQLVTYPAAVLARCLREVIAVSGHAVVPAPHPSPAPSVTGSPRPAPMLQSEKCAHVRETFLASLGREPETIQTEFATAAHILDDGSNIDAVVAAIADSPEGQAWRARLRGTVLGTGAGVPPEVVVNDQAVIDHVIATEHGDCPTCTAPGEVAGTTSS